MRPDPISVAPDTALAPSVEQLALLESGEFLTQPAVRSVLARAAQDAARVRGAVFERISLQIRASGLVTDAAGTVGHRRS